ncbi:hypothetical protein RQP46_006675 [Phenoliferia psychrophenolica]
MDANALPLLLKHYLFLSPTTPAQIPSPPWPTPAELSLPSSQAFLVSNFLSNEAQSVSEEEEAGAAGWRRIFWRRVVRDVEDGFAMRSQSGEDVGDEEIDERLLDAVIAYLPVSTAPPGRCLRTACWGAIGAPQKDWNSIKTWEDGKIITEGTTGLRTWHAGVALSNHVLCRSEPLTAATSILELGAGAGFFSLVAARASPATAKIVATDFDENVLERLGTNITLNELSDTISCSKLNWDWVMTPEGTEELRDWERSTYAAGDLQRPSLIVGADIVYDPSLTAQLAATLAYLLRPAPSTPPDPESQEPSEKDEKVPREALIAGTIRQESTWTGFVAHCHACGLQTEIIELLDAGPDGIVGAEGWEGEGEVRLLRVVGGE